MVANSAAIQRSSKIIGFKAFYERDEDILDWWENIPSGERSHVLRSLIRAYLLGEITVTPYGEEVLAFSSSVQLARVQSDTNWIRDALKDIPNHVEQIINRKLLTLPAQSMPPVASAVPALKTTPEAPMVSAAPPSEDEVQKRTQRTLKVKW